MLMLQIHRRAARNRGRATREEVGVRDAILARPSKARSFAR